MLYTMPARAIPLRFDDETLERIARLERLYAAAHGLQVSRSEVLRLIFARGIAVLENELDWSALPAKDRPKAPRNKTSKR
jgi:hypothetical protein